jgi:hypothetical protein
VATRVNLEQRMLLQILQRTPPWVFLLLLVLIVFGWLQTRTREVPLARVTVLPVILVSLSLSGLFGTFGVNAAALVAWFAALALAIFLNESIRWPRKVSYDPGTRRFLVEGSWAPFAVMMAIFFARYFVAVTLAMKPELAGSLWLPMAVGAGSGLMSGAFLARAWRIIRARPAAVAP